MPRRTSQWVRARFEESRIARLATVGPDGTPHLVPVVFAVIGDTVVTAVDHKPKSTDRLRRLTNVAAEPRVCLLVDAYDEDWSRLWWARADGRAEVVDEPATEAVAALVERYQQYEGRAPRGPYVLIGIERWSGWSAAPDDAAPPEEWA